MKKWIMLSLAVLSLSSVSTFANSEVEMMEEEVTPVTVEMEGEDVAKLDDSIFCSVAMVNWRRQIVRRYNGIRSPRTYRCTIPMAKCRNDLHDARRYGRHGRHHNRGLRCVELRY